MEKVHRGWVLTIWLILDGSLWAAVALSGILAPAELHDMLHSYYYANAPTWYESFFLVLSVCTTASTTAIWLWNRWGLVLQLAVSTAGIVVEYALLHGGPVLLASMQVPMVIFCGLVASNWSFMTWTATGPHPERIRVGGRLHSRLFYVAIALVIYAPILLLAVLLSFVHTTEYYKP